MQKCKYNHASLAGLFARALEGVNVKELITNIGSSAGSGPAAGGAAPAAAAGAAPEKKGKNIKRYKP